MNPGSRKSESKTLTSEHLGLVEDTHCPHGPMKEPRV